MNMKVISMFGVWIGRWCLVISMYSSRLRVIKLMIGECSVFSNGRKFISMIVMLVMDFSSDVCGSVWVIVLLKNDRMILSMFMIISEVMFSCYVVIVVLCGVRFCVLNVRNVGLSISSVMLMLVGVFSFSGIVVMLLWLVCFVRCCVI